MITREEADKFKELVTRGEVLLSEMLPELKDISRRYLRYGQEHAYDKIELLVLALALALLEQRINNGRE